MKKIAKWAAFVLLGLIFLSLGGLFVLKQRLQRWPDVIDYADFRTYRASHAAGYVFDSLKFEYEGKPCSIAFRYSPEGIKSAPTVLLINGFGDRMNSWWRLIDSRRRAGLRYRHYFMVDWPLHGFSDCPQAVGPDKAAEVIRRGLDTLQAEGKLAAPPAVAVASSLGVIVSAYLASYYENLRFVWIVPPLLREPEREALFSFVSGIKTPEDTQAFMQRVMTKPAPLPGYILNPVHRQMTRAVPTLLPIQFETVRKQVLAVAGDRVTVVAGADDALCPPDLLDPEFKRRFSKRFYVLPGCHHDLIHNCIGALMPHLPD